MRETVLRFRNQGDEYQEIHAIIMGMINHSGLNLSDDLYIYIGDGYVDLPGKGLGGCQQ